MIGFGKEKVLMWVARRRLADPFDINRLAKEVSHITGQREAQVLISFQYLIEAVEDALSDGRSVDLGFGTISPAISCTAAEKPEDVEIRKKRVLFRPSKKLRQIVENLSLRLDTYADEDDEETPEDDDIIIDNGDGENTNPDNQGGGSGDPDTPSGGDTPSDGDGDGGDDPDDPLE